MNQMSDEQLAARVAELNAQRDALKQEILKLVNEQNARAAQKSAQAKVAAMSDTERAAMAQLLGAQGVASGSAVGTPGAK